MGRLAAHLAVLVAASLLPLAAHAQSFRTYLASYGNDASPCTAQALR